MDITEYIDKIFILHEEKDTSNLDAICIELKKINVINHDAFPIKLISVKELNEKYSYFLPNVNEQSRIIEISKLIAYNNILKLAITKSWSKIVIIYDTTKFFNEPSIFLNAIRDINNALSRCEILFFSGNGEKKNKFTYCGKYAVVMKNLVHLSGCVVTNKCYLKIINMLEKYDKDIKTFFTEYVKSEKDIFSIYPEIAYIDETQNNKNLLLPSDTSYKSYQHVKKILADTINNFSNTDEFNFNDDFFGNMRKQSMRSTMTSVMASRKTSSEKDKNISEVDKKIIDDLDKACDNLFQKNHLINKHYENIMNNLIATITIHQKNICKINTCLDTINYLEGNIETCKMNAENATTFLSSAIDNNKNVGENLNNIEQILSESINKLKILTQ